MKTDHEYVQEAKIHDPDGSICGWCGKDNDFADDCGWFMFNPLAYDEYVKGERWDFAQEPQDFRYTCKSCHASGIGERHVNYYGQSDR